MSALVLPQDERGQLEAKVLQLCDEGMTYKAIGDIFGITRGAVAGIIYQEAHPSRQKQYVRRLHDLLWQFIERQNPRLTGDVVECAETVLADKQ